MNTVIGGKTMFEDSPTHRSYLLYPCVNDVRAQLDWLITKGPDELDVVPLSRWSNRLDRGFCVLNKQEYDLSIELVPER
jgi:hypothetical protein